MFFCVFRLLDNWRVKKAEGILIEDEVWGLLIPRLESSIVEISHAQHERAELLLRMHGKEANPPCFGHEHGDKLISSHKHIHHFGMGFHRTFCMRTHTSCQVPKGWN